jgi:anaerobic magnesium-protoporphyrin IX monomethyl ester cyclase
LLINPASLSLPEQDAFLAQAEGEGHGYAVRRVPGFAQPMGLTDLAGYIRSELSETSVNLIDFGAELFVFSKTYPRPVQTVGEFKQSILNQYPDAPTVVGISILYSAAFSSSMLIAKQVKEKWPNATVVCGGVLASHAYERILSHDYIDYVIRGEAELAFAEFITRLEANSPVDDITGVLSRRSLENKPVTMAPIIDNLDAIPIPAYDLLDMDLYVREGKVATMFSRGCPFKCTFCASPSVHGHGLREKSNDYILQEIGFLIDTWGIDTLVVYDDLVAANRKKFLALASDLKHFDLKIKMPNALSVAVMTEELIDALEDINLDRFQFAVESGSSYTQKHLINKRVNLNKARSLISYTKQKQEQVFINIILGVPHETRELMEETVEYCKSLEVDWVYFFSALPLPGTVMHKQFRAMGKIDDETDDWDGVRNGRRTFDTDEISAEDLESLVYDSNIQINFIQNSNIRHGRYAEAIRTFDDVVLKQYPYHVVGRYFRAAALAGLNERDRALKELKICRDWVKSEDTEALWLFDRYKDSMPMLAYQSDDHETDFDEFFSTHIAA